MTKRKLNKKNCVKACIFIVSIFLLIWIGASYFDTINHNMPFREDYLHYAKWNIFMLF